jgi:uncharacterized membrane protein YagU involved in acid resistance
MGVYFLTLAAGIIATALMTVLLYSIHWRGFANADMLRALGSILTRSEQTSFLPGALLHFLFGIVFAFIYVGFWSALPVSALWTYLALGVIFGLGHGLVVSFALVVLVAEHHPLQRYQQAGMGVAIAHLLGHVLYGLVVGLLAGVWHLRFGFIPPLI